MKTDMKKLLPPLVLALAAVSLLAVSCDDFSIVNPYKDTLKCQLEGNTLTCQTFAYTHTYTLTEGEQVTTVEFTHFPDNEEEFKAVQEQLLGHSRPGTLALCLFSFEMYRRDRKVGEKCLKLCNLSANATITLSRISQKFPSNRFEKSEDPYVQPYLVATYLKGATEANHYTPDTPYVLTFTYNDNPNLLQGEYSSTYQGHIYYYNVSWNGDGQRNADVLVPDDGSLVMVHGCANLVLGVPSVSGWEDELQ